jgi:hypothetical protein
LSLEGVTVQRGSVGLGFGGPAILNRGGTISVQDSQIMNNNGEGGAIVNFEGTLRLFRTIVSDNVNIHEAGGIFNLGGGIGNGTAVIESSTIARNLADGSGGIENRGTMVVKNSSIIFNTSVGTGAGGGIENLFGGNLQIINSTIAKNIVSSAFREGGGGIAISSGLVSITDTTIRENQVIDGSGGGILATGGATTVQNTIIAGNVIDGFGATGFDCFGAITSIGSNLFGDPSGCTVNLQPTDLTGDPGLGSLVGTEQDALPGRTYYPVLARSPVIDKGNPDACPPTDQLGNPRIGVCDIGAIEFQSVVTVALDVRPRTPENPINPKSNGVIPVAILSTNSFDANTVDPGSVRFGPSQALAQASVQLEDVNGDGQLDLLLHFRTQDSGIQCGDTSASLTGQTVNGVPIQGSDTIRTVGCKASAGKKK